MRLGRVLAPGWEKSRAFRAAPLARAPRPLIRIILSRCSAVSCRRTANRPCRCSPSSSVLICPIFLFRSRTFSSDGLSRIISPFSSWTSMFRSLRRPTASWRFSMWIFSTAACCSGVRSSRLASISIRFSGPSKRGQPRFIFGSWRPLWAMAMVAPATRKTMRAAAARLLRVCLVIFMAQSFGWMIRNFHAPFLRPNAPGHRKPSP